MPFPIKIAGYEFELTREMPYAEGHVLTAVEAAVLNQTWREGIRNNFASRIKAVTEPKEGPKTDLTPDQHTEFAGQLNAYADSFVFSERGPSAPKLDPIEKLARQIAKERLTIALRNDDKEDILKDKERFSALVEKLVTRDDTFIKLAHKRQAELQKASTSVLEGLELAE